MMNITITEAAIDWFKKELSVDQGSGVRFFGKIYGKILSFKRQFQTCFFLLRRPTSGSSKGMIYKSTTMKS